MRRVLFLCSRNRLRSPSAEQVFAGRQDLEVASAGLIVAGIVLGQAVPGPFHALGAATVAQVNLPVAALIWLMVIPMLLKVDLGALRR